MNLLEKYAGKTYSQIFSEFKFPEKDRLEYCHVDTEEICSALQISYSYRSARCEIDFLYSVESGLNWVCTDTGVGLNWLFMKKDGEFILVGNLVLWKNTTRSSRRAYYGASRQV